MKNFIFILFLLVSFPLISEWYPDFFILGEQKCGTTSLYANLCQHPQIVPPKRKETFFFTRNFARNNRWYRKNFTQKKRKKLIFEASTDYFCDDLALYRIKELYPESKFIIILRNPVDRALSHFYHEKRSGSECKDSFESAIFVNAHQMGVESFFDFNVHLNFNEFDSYCGDKLINGSGGSYLSRGMYVKNLKKWFSLFKREQFLILFFEDYITNSQITLNCIYEFLNIDCFFHETIQARNVGNYSKEIPMKLRRCLQIFFLPYNLKLAKLLQQDLPWM